MIAKPTVLVLGAGASMPYGFPSGKQLVVEAVEGLEDGRTLTREEMAGEREPLRTILSKLGFGDREAREFRSALAMSGRQSIDTFIEGQPRFRRIGAAAIAALLIPRGDAQTLEDEREGAWYGYLWNHLGNRASDIGSNRLSIITYNYDRSLECYLAHAMRGAYGLGLPEVRQMLEAIPIVHLHGTLGELPEVGGVGYTRPYSPRAPLDDVQKCADTLRIVTDEIDALPDFEVARRMLDEAAVICFLGFGYNRANVERLHFHRRPANKIVLGSAYDIRYGERPEILSAINGIALGPSTHDTLRFLREYPVLSWSYYSQGGDFRMLASQMERDCRR
jgi:hypothetical protein